MEIGNNYKLGKLRYENTTVTVINRHIIVSFIESTFQCDSIDINITCNRFRL